MLIPLFLPLNSKPIKKFLNRPISADIEALTLNDALQYLKQNGHDLDRKQVHVLALIRRLVLSHVLTSFGGSDIIERLACRLELSTRQQLGWLWLGRTLGSPYIASEIARDIAFISGSTVEDDLAVGTGLLISPNEILTCGHVITDLCKISEVRVGGKVVSFNRKVAHPKIDVGVIYLKESITAQLPDLAFRAALILEEVLIAGYPSVPRSLAPTLTFQRGEICGHVPETQDGWAMDLFSAIARPGNSGGPVVALDGRVVGIITRSLEREKELADAMAPMPFFSAVPSRVIAVALAELSDGATRLPWEDWQ